MVSRSVGIKVYDLIPLLNDYHNDQMATRVVGKHYVVFPGIFGEGILHILQNSCSIELYDVQWHQLWTKKAHKNVLSLSFYNQGPKNKKLEHVEKMSTETKRYAKE